MYLLLVSCFLLCLTQLMTGESKINVADKIVAMEKAALDRWIKGDPDGFLEISSDEVTYFDPFLEKRLDGLMVLKKRYETMRGKVNNSHYEMIDPKVQLCGNTAVLTFNFKGYSKNPDGSEKLRSHWHTTEVYSLIHGRWKIISTHWSFNRSMLIKVTKTTKSDKKNQQ
jgi:hypothetical protein